MGNFLGGYDFHVTYDVYEEKEEAEKDIWYENMEGNTYAVKIVSRNPDNPNKIEWYWFIGGVFSI